LILGRVKKVGHGVGKILKRPLHKKRKETFSSRRYPAATHAGGRKRGEGMRQERKKELLRGCSNKKKKKNLKAGKESSCPFEESKRRAERGKNHRASEAEFCGG